MAINNPLRYPGGKSSLVEYVSKIITEYNYKDFTFIEPYAGSASISLSLLSKDIVKKVFLIEKDPLIYAFWYSVFNDTDNLIERIDRLDISLNTWHQMKNYRDIEIINRENLIDLGVACIFLNRTNFSGILNAGPLGGQKQLSAYKIDCRFNKQSIIQRIKMISELRKKVTLIHGDAINYLDINKRKLQKKCFLYVDPPYYIQGKSLYRYWHNYNEHKLLAEKMLKLKVPWLISYDYHKDIQALYKNNVLNEIYLDYSLNNKRQAQELLISNIEIPPEVSLKITPA